MKRGLASTAPQTQPGHCATSPTPTQLDGQTSSHTDTNSPYRMRKTNYIKSCCLASSSERLSLCFTLSDRRLSQLLMPVVLAHFINLSSLSVLCSSAAPEKEAHRERHCHHNLSGAWSVAFHPAEHSLTLPARLCYCPCAQPLLRRHLLQVNVF